MAIYYIDGRKVYRVNGVWYVPDPVIHREWCDACIADGYPDEPLPLQQPGEVRPSCHHGRGAHSTYSNRGQLAQPIPSPRHWWPWQTPTVRVVDPLGRVSEMATDPSLPAPPPAPKPPTYAQMAAKAAEARRQEEIAEARWRLADILAADNALIDTSYPGIVTLTYPLPPEPPEHKRLRLQREATSQPGPDPAPGGHAE